MLSGHDFNGIQTKENIIGEFANGCLFHTLLT